MGGFGKSAATTRGCIQRCHWYTARYIDAIDPTCYCGGVVGVIGELGGGLGEYFFILKGSAQWPRG